MENAIMAAFEAAKAEKRARRRVRISRRVYKAAAVTEKSVAVSRNDKSASIEMRIFVNGGCKALVTKEAEVFHFSLQRFAAAERREMFRAAIFNAFKKEGVEGYSNWRCVEELALTLLGAFYRASAQEETELNEWNELVSCWYVSVPAGKSIEDMFLDALAELGYPEKFSSQGLISAFCASELLGYAETDDERISDESHKVRVEWLSSIPDELAQDVDDFIDGLSWKLHDNEPDQLVQIEVMAHSLNFVSSHGMHGDEITKKVSDNLEFIHQVIADSCSTATVCCTNKEARLSSCGVYLQGHCTAAFSQDCWSYLDTDGVRVPSTNFNSQAWTKEELYAGRTYSHQERFLRPKKVCGYWMDRVAARKYPHTRKLLEAYAKADGVRLYIK